MTYVKDFISFNKLSIAAILETHVKSDSADYISRFICSRFSWIFNYDCHVNGRIWIGYDPTIWKVTVLAKSEQHITCLLCYLASGISFVSSFIYGLNTTVERRRLWHNLDTVQQAFISDSAWCLLGDFNTCLCSEETNNSNNWTASIREFKDFVSNLGLTDLNCSGPLFTWWDKNTSSPVQKKLDRCLVNCHWLHNFSLSFARVLSRGLSDHNPIAVSLGFVQERVFKPFQFFQHLTLSPSFLPEVASAWQEEIIGTPWFILTMKLKKVKNAMRRLNTATGNLHSASSLARNLLLDFQNRMPINPNPDQFLEEDHLIKAYHNALNAEEIFLKQKSRVTWLKNGDANNKFFFNSCKDRWNTNKIFSLEDNEGHTISSHRNISEIAVAYYTNLFGRTSNVNIFPDDLILPQLSVNQQMELSRPFTADDIWQTIKSMPRNKSPGPDGLTVEFFMAAWNIIGADVVKGILYFFQTLILPRAVSAASLVLVPKIYPTKDMADFRPIACCNVLYKCITKMLASRLKPMLADIISPSQSAFVPHRLIGDNVLLAQALFKNYHLSSGKPRCAFKIDIKKAFDTLHWNFLVVALRKMGFPAIYINWVMKCIESCMISIKVNGSLEGFFNAKSGLRQGDPLSPYLFVIAMEVFTACMNKQAASADFRYHWQCQPLSITHLIFADDLMLFCYGDQSSIKAVLEGVNNFASISGLVPNKDKSLCFFSSMDDVTVDYTLQASGVQRGTLPIRYLGLPLISTKLTLRDCSSLIARIRSRIDKWTTCTLSQAGRLQLLKVVLFGIQGYWSNHLFLPKSVLKQLQTLFIKFLWGGSSINTKQVKVSWHDCCKLKSEGGLGIRDLCQWNTASFLHHLWRIIQPSNTNSIWIAWLRNVVIKEKPFWSMKLPSHASWCLKKILNLRPLALHHIRYTIGNNSNFLFWHDPWFRGSSLMQCFDSSIISIAESNAMIRAGAYINNRQWTLPNSNHVWIIELRELLSNWNISSNDLISWHDLKLKQVTVSSIWNSLRPPEISLPWVQAIWHPFHIPKCAFTLWLALKNRLLTKDRMLRFGMNTDSRCCLCGNHPETTSHLFSSCAFSREVFMGLYPNLVGNWDDYLRGQFTPTSCSNLKKSVSYLYVSVAVFYIWKERNDIIHNASHTKVTPAILRFNIKRMVREKLSSQVLFQRAAAKNPTLIVDLY